MGTSMHFGARRNNILYSRKLRLRITMAEEILWNHIKKKQLGVRFRNQHPVSSFVVDFYSHEIRLIVEADGSIHDQPNNAVYDEFREQELIDLGLHIIRFRNEEIIYDIESVLSRLKEKIAELQKPKTPPPPKTPHEPHNPLSERM